MPDLIVSAVSAETTTIQPDHPSKMVISLNWIQVSVFQINGRTGRKSPQQNRNTIDLSMSHLNSKLSGSVSEKDL